MVYSGPQSCCEQRVVRIRRPVYSSGLSRKSQELFVKVFHQINSGKAKSVVNLTFLPQAIL
jgi:hypothetical protein